jgi:hypothetical protein
MFTGFASENTPAIQVWDFFRAFASNSAVRSVSLADDCAPIQVFRTGATTSSLIRVYLPTSPIEGKQITIVNQQYGVSAQKIEIYSADVSGAGSQTVLNTLGVADSIVLVYSKQNITYGTSSGLSQTGWISLNKSCNSSGSYGSAVIGGDSNSASSNYSFVGGGSSNTASGSNAAVVGGISNTASGSYAGILAGTGNTASGTYSAVVGGAGNNISVTHSGIVGGSSNTVSNPYSAVIGGDTSNASGNNSVVLGGAFGITRSIQGNLVCPASINPVALTVGGSQTATLLLGRQTTDATATRLTSNTSAASTTNQVILPNNSAYTFQGTCIANVTGGGNTSGWKFEGVIKRGANAASTALVAAVTPTVIAQDAGASTWVLAITADTTNGGIAVTVTGQAATTIRWVVQIETTEVTF